MPSTEALLVLGVIGFYLVDSAMLLYSNETVLAERNGRWNWSCGSPWQILRRNPYLPNPLTPDSLLFRTSWSASPPDQQPNDHESVRALALALIPLRYMVVVLLFLLVVGLPLFLYLKASNILMLLALAIYSVGLAIVFVLYRRRRALGLTGRSFAGLAFEVLACPPLAINVVRKITLRETPIRDPIAFAQSEFSADQFATLLTAIQAWVDDELESEDEKSERKEKLDEFRARLVAIEP